MQKGNLLTLPVGGGLLYVQPVYVRGTTGTTYPQLRAVITVFGGELAWATTLDKALDQLFKGDSGAPSTSPAPGNTSKGKPGTGATSPDLAAVLAEIQKQYKAGDAAVKRGDWAAYGEAQKALSAAIERAVELSPQGGRVTVTPAPTSSKDAASSVPSGTPTGR